MPPAPRRCHMRPHRLRRDACACTGSLACVASGIDDAARHTARPASGCQTPTCLDALLTRHGNGFNTRPPRLGRTFTTETSMNVPYQIPGRAPDEDRSQNVSNYWRERFTEESYYTEGDRYEDYESAYLAGHEARIRENARLRPGGSGVAPRLGSQPRHQWPELEQGVTQSSAPGKMRQTSSPATTSQALNTTTPPSRWRCCITSSRSSGDGCVFTVGNTMHHASSASPHRAYPFARDRTGRAALVRCSHRNSLHGETTIRDKRVPQK